MDRQTLRSLLADLPGARVVAPSAGGDEMSAFTPTQESIAEDANTVGGEPFQIIDVPIIKRTGFTHFLDGAQRSWKGAYVGFAPVYLAHTSAGIVERSERDVQPPSVYSGELEAFVPAGGDAAGRISPLLAIVSVEGEEDATGEAVQDLALQRISERRDERERMVARQFVEGKLLVDGGIGHIVAPEGKPQPFVVGMVKSHRKQYFKSLERTEAILAMHAGQRSSLFVRTATHSSELDVWSFYLRLHEDAQQGPLFGVVRIEVPARKEFEDQIDEIAGWLLHERAPLSLPDARYDRMLYPIRLVEQHLKARQPSDAFVRALIGV